MGSMNTINALAGNKKKLEYSVSAMNRSKPKVAVNATNSNVSSTPSSFGDNNAIAVVKGNTKKTAKQKAKAKRVKKQ